MSGGCSQGEVGVGDFLVGKCMQYSTALVQNAHAEGAKRPGGLLAPTSVGVLTIGMVKTPTWGLVFERSP